MSEESQFLTTYTVFLKENQLTPTNTNKHKKYLQTTSKGVNNIRASLCTYKELEREILITKQVDRFCKGYFDNPYKVTPDSPLVHAIFQQNNSYRVLLERIIRESRVKRIKRVIHNTVESIKRGIVYKIPYRFWAR